MRAWFRVVVGVKVSVRVGAKARFRVRVSV